MNNKLAANTNTESAIKELRRYLLEKGHTFERAPAYQAQEQTPISVNGAIKMYEGMGYTKIMQLGNPPQYAVLERGHQEVHILQPQDPQVRAWLDDHQQSLNDPSMRAYLEQSAGLSESDIQVAAHPKHFRLSQVGDVYIISGENAK